MADAQLQELVQEHHALDEQLARLAHLSHLSDQEHFEEAALKKRKLALKDRIEALRKAEGLSHGLQPHPSV